MATTKSSGCGCQADRQERKKERKKLRLIDRPGTSARHGRLFLMAAALARGNRRREADISRALFLWVGGLGDGIGSYVQCLSNRLGYSNVEKFGLVQAIFFNSVALDPQQ